MDGPQTMLYTTVVDDAVPEADGHHSRGSRQGHLMRLATFIDLDSQLTVRILLKNYALILTANVT